MVTWIFSHFIEHVTWRESCQSGIQVKRQLQMEWITPCLNHRYMHTCANRWCCIAFTQIVVSPMSNTCYIVIYIHVYLLCGWVVSFVHILYFIKYIQACRRHTCMWWSRVEKKSKIILSHISIVSLHSKCHIVNFSWGGTRACFVGAWISKASMKNVWAHPQWRFSSTALQMQQCDQNMQLNNLRFLHELPHHYWSHTWHSFFSLKFQPVWSWRCLITKAKKGRSCIIHVIVLQ